MRVRLPRSSIPVLIVLMAAASSGCVPEQDQPLDTVQQAATAPAWVANKWYATGALVTFNGMVYKCVQGHTSQVGWEPPKVASLWERPTPTGVLPWTTQTRYLAGSGVTFNGATYECIQGHLSQSDWTPPKATSL